MVNVGKINSLYNNISFSPNKNKISAKRYLCLLDASVRMSRREKASCTVISRCFNRSMGAKFSWFCPPSLQKCFFYHSANTNFAMDPLVLQNFQKMKSLNIANLSYEIFTAEPIYGLEAILDHHGLALISVLTPVWYTVKSEFFLYLGHKMKKWGSCTLYVVVV